MKIRSTKDLPYAADRSGIKRGIIEIDLTITNKDDVNKIYTLKAVDYLILPEGSVTVTPYPPMMGMMSMVGKQFIFEKTYLKTYAEYDAQREYLKTLDASGLVGSELDDKLLQDALLYSAMTDTVYESTHEDWEAYTEPIIVVTPPVLDSSDGKLISGESLVNGIVTLSITQDEIVNTFDIVAGLSGQFAHMPYPVLTEGTTIRAVVKDMFGRVSSISNVIIVSIPEEIAEPLINPAP